MILSSFSKRNNPSLLSATGALLVVAVTVSSFLVSSCYGFTTPASISVTSRSKVMSPTTTRNNRNIIPRIVVARQSTTKLYRIRCENKYYQLEEMEDRENATTECYLKQDGTVVLGDTDGPLWTSAQGKWYIQDDGFIMTITKKFGAGTDSSDMGEFEYELERTFIGDMTVVGESVAITGVMKSDDVLTGKEKEVGFFNMIDGTDARIGKRPDSDTVTRTDPKPDVPAQVQGHDGIPSGMTMPPTQPQSYSSYSGEFGQQQQQQQQQQPSDPYSYGQQRQQTQPSYSYQGQQQPQAEPQQAADPYGYGQQQSQEQTQNDPYAAYYNQYQQQQQQQQPSVQPPAQQQGYGGGYGQQQQQAPKQQLDPYGPGAFGQSQSPHPSSNFGSNEFEGQPQQQQQNDPYGYGQQQQGYGQGQGQGQGEGDPNPPPISPYGEDGYGQNAWGG